MSDLFRRYRLYVAIDKDKLPTNGDFDIEDDADVVRFLESFAAVAAADVERIDDA